MNRIERSFGFGQEAKIRYLDGEFQVLKNGTYVRCAVTGEPIRIEDLRYWSVAHQEAYLNAEVSLRRHLERLGKSHSKRAGGGVLAAPGGTGI